MPRAPIADRLYRLLLRCYPGEFRDEYEREMQQAFLDRLDQDRAAGAGAVVRLWRQVITDAILLAPAEHLDVLRQDIRYAARTLRRAPLFALTAIATLAVGVGANTAIFSVVHAVALRPLHYADSNRLIRIWEDNPPLAINGFSVSWPNFADWRERSRTLDLAAWQYDSVTIRGTRDPVRVSSLTVTPEFLSILSVRPRAGRIFTAADAAPSGSPVALLSEGLWNRQFGGDPDVVGRAITVGDSTAT